MRRDDFRSLVRDFLLLEQEEQTDPSKPIENGEASLDAQVDRLLISYEKEAKSSKNEGLDMRSLTRSFLIEANKDDKGAGEKLTSEDIDVESFAASVVRLIENYDSLIEVRDALVRRSRNFLAKNYDDATLNDFLSVLRDNFDIEVGVTDLEKQGEIKAPAADRAGSSPAA